MGGRGSGSTILDGHVGGQGIIEGGSSKWRDIVSDFNPHAGHRDVGAYQGDTLRDFARVSKEQGKSECEYLGAMKDGYMMKVAQGVDGAVRISPEMRAEVSGMDITHYHNRRAATEQEKAETAEDYEKYRMVKRAFKRIETARARYKAADEEFKQTHREIQMAGADPYDNNPPARLRPLYDRLNAADKERGLAIRQRVRAEGDFRDRFKAYKGTDAPKDPRQFGMPELNNGIIDQEGWIGGCFSPEDIDSSFLSHDIPSFSVSADEGTYTIKPRTEGRKASADDLMMAKDKIRKLFNPKIETDEVLEFRRKIRSIDRITTNEGNKNGWSKQRIIATSVNRQLSYLWSVEQSILGEYNINATYTPNPDFKPKWEY